MNLSVTNSLPSQLLVFISISIENQSEMDFGPSTGTQMYSYNITIATLMCSSMLFTKILYSLFPLAYVHVHACMDSPATCVNKRLSNAARTSSSNWSVDYYVQFDIHFVVYYVYVHSLDRSPPCDHLISSHESLWHFLEDHEIHFSCGGCNFCRRGAGQLPRVPLCYTCIIIHLQLHWWGIYNWSKGMHYLYDN